MSILAVIATTYANLLECKIKIGKKKKDDRIFSLKITGKKSKTKTNRTEHRQAGEGI